MEQDTRKRALSAALIAIATAGAFAGPAAAGGNDEAPNGQPPAHAPAHGVRGETPPAHAGGAEQSPPQHAPAHGTRGTQPRSSKSQRAPKAKPKRAAPKSSGAKPAPPAHAPAHGVRGTKPSKAKGPKKSQSPSGTKENSGGGQPKVTICHATGSETNPYVEITVAKPAAENGHARHHDGADIIPAPEGGCPTSPAAAAAPEAAGGGATGIASSGSPVVPTGAPAGPPIITSSQMGTAPDGRIRVLGEIDTEAGTAETADSASAAPAAEVEEGSNGLPFTGLSLIAVVLAGLAALLTGIALWRATRAPGRPTA